MRRALLAATRDAALSLGSDDWWLAWDDPDEWTTDPESHTEMDDTETPALTTMGSVL